MRIAILIPTIRPELGEKLYHNVVALADSEHQVCYKLDNTRQGCPRMVNEMMREAYNRVDAFMFLGDDTEIDENTIPEAIKAMGDTEGVVGLNDGAGEGHSCHFLVHKKAVENFLDGEFFHEGYNHCFCDNELIFRAKLEKKYTFARKAIVHHDNPLIKGQSDNWRENLANSGDKDLKRAYGFYAQDQALFNKRAKQFAMERVINVGIGVPSNDLVHADFALSLAKLFALCIPSGIQPVIINQRSSMIAHGRQKLFDEALAMKLDYLLCLDSDMTFPQETLLRLLSHNVDFVCVDAPRRRPPFSTVLKGVDDNPIDHTTEQSAPLLEIKGISTAISLTRLSLFERCEIQWPLFQTPYLGEGRYQGEDRYFGDRLQEAGVKTYCDLALSRQITHIGIQYYKI